MGLFDRFFKKDETPVDPLKDLTLKNLKPGYYVDFDMKTWEVTAANTYDWGNGYFTFEWQLVNVEETIYLEREPDDEDFWSISRKIPFSGLGDKVLTALKETGDPPETIRYEGTTFHMEESGGGYFHKNSENNGREFLQWSYEDDEGEQYLTIEQWGEQEFEAFSGHPAMEYQFTNILPANGG